MSKAKETHLWFEKGDDELTEMVNKALKELKEEGKLAEIFEKYDLPYDAE